MIQIFEGLSGYFKKIWRNLCKSLGNPEEISINKLASKIKSKINNNLNIIFKPLPEDDPKQRKPDITRAKEILNWEPKFDLEMGLDSTIKYFKSII